MVENAIQPGPRASEAVSQAAPPKTAGDVVVPGYKVLAHLRRSRSYDIYDAWSDERACRCIAKVLRQDRLDDSDARDRLVLEGRLLQRFTHLHLVRAYDTLLEPFPTVILETLTGETLGHLIENRRSRLPLDDIVWLGLHLCSAIHYLHSQGFLHIDLKPSNIIAQDRLAKVIDLSLTRPPGPSKGGAGTPQYMAPEQVNAGTLTPATDVWGIGAVLWEAATGQMPFGRRRRAYEQLKRRAEPLRSLRRVPLQFAATVDRCLSPEPGDRPALDELAEVLRSFTRHGGTPWST